jgi:hypothetical protein
MEENTITIVLNKPIKVANSNMSSVDIKRNAKGIVEFVVKAYADDIEAASAKAQTIFDKLSEKY